MTPTQIALLIFSLTYLLFMTKMVHKAVAALLGAMLMVAYGIVPYEEVGQVIDFKTLTVVVGMMITLNVIKGSGLFEYLAIKAAKITKGEPVQLMVMFVVLAVILPAFFSNVISILILGSLLYTICKKLHLDFKSYLLMVTLAVNIGGLLTPISSLPNIMISSVTGLGFSDFFKVMFPLGVILTIVSIIFFRFVFKKAFSEKISKSERGALMNLDENEEIKDHKLFIRSVIILIGIIVMFLAQDITGIGNEAVAIGGAIIMLLLSSKDPEQMISEVQWSTIAFFIGLFVVVGGVEHVGLLETASSFIAEYVHEPITAVLTIISSASFVSSVVDNIPVTAILLPIVKNLNVFLHLSSPALYFAIVTGAALGGNITPVGSPSGVIAMGIAEKYKKKIKFGEFMMIGGTLSIIHIVIAAIYFSIIL